jgi:hypothetical protein
MPVAWLIGFFLPGETWVRLIGFPFPPGLTSLGGLLLHPFAFGRQDLLPSLFGGLVAYWTGRVIESRRGCKGMLIAWGLASISGALLWLVGRSFMDDSGLLAGPSIPLAAFICLWAAWNKGQKVMLMMIIPVPAPVIAALSGLGVLALYGMQNPIAGLLPALVPLAYWLHGDGRMPLPGWASAAGRADSRRRRQIQRELDDAKRREIDREERERLRRLFEASLEEDPPER